MQKIASNHDSQPSKTKQAVGWPRLPFSPVHCFVSSSCVVTSH